MAKGDELPETNAKEIEALIERFKKYEIEKRDAELIERLLRTVIMLLCLLERKNLSIKRLKDLLFQPPAALVVGPYFQEAMRTLMFGSTGN